MSGNQTQAAPNLSALFGSAVATGDLTAAGAAVLQVPDYGAAIQAGLGCNIDDVTASEVFLVAVIIDDSSSIRFVSGNTEAVRNGHNEVVRALDDSKQGDSIQIFCAYLNKGVLYDFRPIDQAVEMTAQNYNPNGGTPLYRATVAALGTVMAKAQQFMDAGVVVRTATLIVTDGHDEDYVPGKKPTTAVDVKNVVQGMLVSERHIVAGMGISDGGTNFRQIFSEMGIPDQWILTPGNTHTEIRRAFGTFSKSAVRASKAATGAAFSQVAAGGFGSP